MRVCVVGAGPSGLTTIKQLRDEGHLVKCFEKNDNIGGMKKWRILQRLVLALGDREEGHAKALAQVERGRADEVAHVLDEKQIERPGIQIAEGPGYHVGIEMAERAGSDLNDLCARGTKAPGVVVGLQIADYHPYALRPAQFLYSLLQQCGLAGARRRKDIEDKKTQGAEEAAVALREAVVCLEDGAVDLYGTGVAVVVRMVVVVMFMVMIVLRPLIRMPAVLNALIH